MNYLRKLSLGKNRLKQEKIGSEAIKAVFMASFAQHQDTAILLSRFFIDAQVISLNNTVKNIQPSSVSFGQKDTYWPQLATTPDTVFTQIRTALNQNPDVIILAALPEWGNYPKDIRNKIKSLVASGKSLFLMNNEQLVKEFTQNNELNWESSGKLVDITAKSYKCGSGMIASYNIDLTNHFGYFVSDSEFEAEFEYSVDFFAKCVTRAVYGSPNKIIRTVNICKNKFKISLNNHSEVQLNLDILRYEDYSSVSSICKNIESNSLEYTFEDFPADKYIAELKLYDNRQKLLDWKTVSFVLKNDLQIVASSLKTKNCEPGEQISGTIELEKAMPDLQMRVRWIDGWGRLLEEGKMLPFTSNFSLAVPKKSLSVMNRLEIELCRDAKVIKLLPFEISIPKNTRKQVFPFLLWNLTDEFSWKQKLYLDNVRTEALGGAICNCSRNEMAARYAAQSHLQTVPYTTWFHKVGLDNNLFNDAWCAATRKKAKTTALNHRDYGPMGYTLGDECYVDAFTKGGRFSASEHVWKKFRNYLKKLYADSLENLNKQWETDFKNWDVVKFERDSELLRSFDNPSPWTDFRMFIATTFATTFRELKMAIRQHDPNALVGWDGCEEYSSYDGIDWWEFTREMEINVVYAGSTLGGSSGFTNRTFNSQAVKSFQPDAPLSGAFMNSIDYNYGGEYSTWQLLFNGYKSMWWWHASYPDNECGALKWDMTPTKIVGDITEALSEIRNGIDTMLTHATKQYSPIAIHYSANNFHASTIESGVGNHINNIGITKTEFWMAEQITGRTIKADSELMEMFGGIKPSGHYGPAFKNFYLLLKDIGYQPQTIARQQIELNKLSELDIKVLVLPFVVSLSDAEVTAIQTFVKNGGLLIADYHCGLRDLHGKTRKQPALDDIFGVKHKSNKVLRGHKKVAIEYNFSKGGNFEIVFSDELEILGSGCVLDSYDDGTPMVGAGTSAFGCHDNGDPAFIVNHYGQGKALLLNFDLYSYEHSRQEKRHIDMLEMFQFVIWKLASLAPEINPQYENGSSAGTIETVKLKDQANIYHGIIPDFAIFDKASIAGTVNFPIDKHIYDVRNHTYLGAGKQNMPFAPGKPLLFAELPDKIAKIEISVPPATLLGQEISIEITVDTSKKMNIPFTVKLEIEQPDGYCPEYYVQTLYLESGTGTFSFTPALNSPTGFWNIKCTECISGMYSECIINIQNRATPALVQTDTFRPEQENYECSTSRLAICN
jgi:Beta-galactosidase trimerisation domain